MGSISNTIWMIRPWITDFSAYDHFAQPRGFLSLAEYLRSRGWDVRYVDCLERQSASAKGNHPGGRYTWTEIKKPDVLADIPRRYKRYGISMDTFHNTLDGLPLPGAILITTGMTYWYPGLIQTIHELEKRYPEIPMAAGGIYTTLCPDHAQRLSRIRSFPGHISRTFITWLESVTGISSEDFPGHDCLPPPAWDLVPNTSYAVLNSSVGCRHQCRYCAAANFFPTFISHSFTDLTREINTILDGGTITDIALYDDDFADTDHLNRFLEFLVRNRFPVKWHLPNALSIHSVTPETATLLKKSGFNQPRLSVNYIDRVLSDHGFSSSVLNRFSYASDCLQQAGYDPTQISAYILAGLPHQSLTGLEHAAMQLRDRNINPYFSQFSPIPGTPLGDQRLLDLGYNTSGELLLTNKLLSVYRHPGWTWQEYYNLNAAMRGNREQETSSNPETDPPDRKL